MKSQLSYKSNKRTKSKTNKKPHGSGAARGGWSLGPELGRWEEWVGVQGPRQAAEPSSQGASLFISPAIWQATCHQQWNSI